MWALDQPAPVRVFMPHLSDAEVATVHPNLHYVLTGSSDKAARLFDVTNGWVAWAVWLHGGGGLTVYRMCSCGSVAHRRARQRNRR